MNTPRTRRLAILPLAALAVVVPALPALASTGYDAGCTNAPGDYSASIPNEAPLTHSGPYTSVSVDPQGETLRAAATMTWNGTPTGDQCAANGDYRDTITVVGAGLPAGSMVDVTAVVRLVGDITTTGTGAPLHVAEGDVDASFQLRHRFADFGVPDTLYVRGDGFAYDHNGEDGSTFSHSIEVDGVQEDSSYSTDLVDGLRPFDIGTQTVTFSVPVGSVLDVISQAGAVATSYDGEGASTARIDEFSVKLSTTTPGVTLDRGDGPAPDPDPQPQPTALDQVEAARTALASYSLHKGIAHALDVKLAHAERDIQAAANACDDLSSFTSQVAAQRGKKLTTAQAGALTAFSTSATDTLDC